MLHYVRQTTRLSYRVTKLHADKYCGEQCACTKPRIQRKSAITGQIGHFYSLPLNYLSLFFCSTHSLLTDEKSLLLMLHYIQSTIRLSNQIIKLHADKDCGGQCACTKPQIEYHVKAPSPGKPSIFNLYFIVCSMLGVLPYVCCLHTIYIKFTIDGLLKILYEV